MIRRSVARVAATLALSAVLGVAWLTPAAAQTRPPSTHTSPVRAPLVRFAGQVLQIRGPAGNPTGFLLQTEDRALDFLISPKAAFKALSAEAEVEGLQRSDYANVFARSVSGVWMAQRIVFDIVPIGTMAFQVTGMILKVSRDGKHFQLRLDSGPYNGLSRWVAVLRQTRWSVDGQPISAPQALAQGLEIQALVRRQKTGWVALAVNLKSSQISPF